MVWPQGTASHNTGREKTACHAAQHTDIQFELTHRSVSCSRVVAAGSHGRTSYRWGIGRRWRASTSSHVVTAALLSFVRVSPRGVTDCELQITTRNLSLTHSQQRAHATHTDQKHAVDVKIERHSHVFISILPTRAPRTSMGSQGRPWCVTMSMQFHKKLQQGDFPKLTTLRSQSHELGTGGRRNFTWSTSVVSSR
jgi:hypothetical protein